VPVIGEPICCFLGNLFRIEPQVFKYWINMKKTSTKTEDFFFNSEMCLLYGYDSMLVVSRREYLNDIVRVLTITSGTTELNLLILLCRVAFQYSMFPEIVADVTKTYNGRLSQRYYVRLIHLLKIGPEGTIARHFELFRTYHPLEYRRFRFFMDEFPRFPLYSMARKYYETRLVKATDFFVVFLNRPNSKRVKDMLKRLESSTEDV